jgi:glutamate-1-semialdehyde 2,1-aminomutase
MSTPPQTPSPVEQFRPSRHVVTPSDRELFERHLASFVPPDAFDVHAHFYTLSALFPGRDDAPPDRPGDRIGAAVYREQLTAWMGESRCPGAGLFFGLPSSPTVDAAKTNAFVAGEIPTLPGSRGLMLVRPDDDPAGVERRIEEGGFVGFKVYHLFSTRPDTFNAAVHEYLPRWMWEIAHRRGLVILLHLVRARALADESNQQELRQLLREFGGAKLILAHAGRGFCAGHTVEGIESLAGLENVFFDTSAVCEPGAFEAIVRQFGTRRLMFGTDYPISNFRGRCTSMADGFFWMFGNNVDFASGKPHAEPTLVGIESLLALRQACRATGLTDADVERVFCTNARELFGLRTPSDAGGQSLYANAKRKIPGGVQLLSKRPEMYAPGQWPPYFAEANGVEVVDVDGRRFVDMTTMGVGTCLLGYSDPDVNAAVVRRVHLGSTCTLNSPDEPLLADALLALHPWARMVRFARTGGEAMAVAVRIARARSRRDRVAFCGYHGWHDWYLAANVASPGAAADGLGGHLMPGLDPAGVPRGLGGTTLPFTYNQIDELHDVLARHAGEIGAIVMEPTRAVDPAPGFLEGVRELADRHDVPLIFDEITAGFRLHRGGAHLRYRINPDIAVFAKALGNGVPIAAIIGNADTMQAAQASFVSSTLWTEGLGFAAGLATLRKMARHDVPRHVATIGTLFRNGLVSLARVHDVPLALTGHPALTFVSFAHPEDAAAMQTLFTVRMLARGFLAAGGFYPSLMHEPRHVEAYLAAADEAFAEIAAAISRGDLRERIGGPVKHSGFARLA